MDFSKVRKFFNPSIRTDRLVHQILTVLTTINPEKSLLLDPEPGPSSPSTTYA